MKTRILASTVGSLLLWCLPPLAAQEAGGRSLVVLPRAGEFVGVTTQKVQPGGGHFALARTCQAQFPRSHVCSSAEILANPRVPVLTEASSAAWVNPSNVTVVNAPAGSTWRFAFVDASGVVEESDDIDAGLNCKAWGGSATSYGQGLVVSFYPSLHFLGFSKSYCSSTLAVACCS